MHDCRISSGLKLMSPQLVNAVLNETCGHWRGVVTSAFPSQQFAGSEQQQMGQLGGCKVTCRFKPALCEVRSCSSKTNSPYSDELHDNKPALHIVMSCWTKSKHSI